MKTNLVHIVKKDILTDSVVISEMLEVPHKVLLNTIEKIVESQKNKDTAMPLKFPQKFIESSFLNKMNRSYKMYELNEQAYMKLAMHLKGYEKAEKVQDAIIEAFSLMKEALLNQSNASWLNARNEGKDLRRSEMDVVKEFVEYATEQGSKSAFRYYSNITKMTNKALELLVQVKEGSPLRNLASITELGYIQMLDNRAKQAIEYGMNEKLPYTHIYKLAKEQVNILADSLNFTKSIES
jgi:phage regulator Rha-like protein